MPENIQLEDENNENGVKGQQWSDLGMISMFRPALCMSKTNRNLLQLS